MSDLPPVIHRALDRLQLEISQLRRGGGRRFPKPHKLLMLLAVLDLAEDGLLPDNEIYFDERLIELFERHFRQFAHRDDWCQPGPPFFHLRSADFWHHKVLEGREQEYAKLQTSGGGTKRIVENIKYAYLSPYAFSVVSEPTTRNLLRNFLYQQLKEEVVLNRIGTMFHESFSLSRPAIGAILSTIDSLEPAKGLHAALQEQTHLGRNYIKAMPRYARGCGLLTEDNQLTAFGALALEHDALLENQATQWLMHYYMSAPHGPGPAFWHEFIRTRFRYGDELTKASLAEQLVDFYKITESKKLTQNSATSTANAFIGTYEKDDALGRLGLIEEYDGSYRILEPDPPPTWAFAVALLDYCQHQFPGQLTINLDALYAEGGLTSIFMVGAGRINRYLRILQQAGLVDVFRVAPPYQVVLLNPDPSFALARLYTSDDDE